MKIQYLLFAVLVSANTLSAQTGIIAHKSHSGTASTFAFADPGNFGAPPARIVKIERINDTTVIQTMDRWGGNRADTIYNHPLYSDPNVSADSLRKILKYDETEVIENKTPPLKVETLEVKPIKTINPGPGDKSVPVSKEKRKKKGSLLLFWILGGGTLTGIVILTAKRTRNANTASKLAAFP